MPDATESRKIIHVDMDAFYASVEQRDNPDLRGRPLAVGGRPGTRGVVAAASYEARRFGVHSAMPARKASQLCPDLVFVRPRLGHYREVSRQIHAIFKRHTDLIEPLSLDEAYLDVTENKTGIPYASQVAKSIRAAIHSELQLTASAGVAPMKFLAKIASDMRKPDGLTVITPDKVQATIDALTIEQIWGVGPRTAARMHALGIHTGQQLREYPLHELIQTFGKSGMHFHRLAHGLDSRPVRPGRRRKSIGSERTFAEDIRDRETVRNILYGQLENVCNVAASKDLNARCLTLKLRYADFTTVTRSTSWHDPLLDIDILARHMEALIDKTDLGARPIRLAGISLSGLQYPGDLLQGELWPNNQPVPSNG